MLIQRKIEKVMTWVGGVEKQIRPEEHGWKPGANTLLYLPLKSDVVDKSGKSGRTFTSSVSYTTVGGVQSAYVSSTGGIIMTAPNPIADSSTMDKTKQTISLWYYVTSESSSRRRTILEFTKQSIEFVQLVLKENTSLVQYGNENGWVGSGTTILPNRWNNVVVTGDSSARKIYINGTLKWSGTGASNPRGSWSYSYQQNQCIMCSRDGTSYGESLGGNLSDLIMEDKVRTASDVSDYFNLTKSNYGL